MSLAAGNDGSLSFLAGGGEMGERIRAFDWSSTSLGPPQNWPQSLKTSIRIMLMSRQPVWIGWGEDLLYFYNDPYFSIIGGRHPWALGRPTREIWKEIWDIIGPMLASAMSGDEGTYVESQLLIMERNGYPEETYYTFSYSPIPDDAGQPGGIFCANSEDTQRVIGQRELALLRELAARTGKSATPADACSRSIAALATDPHDLPFAAIYLVDDETKTARQAEVTGIESGHSAAPSEVALDDPRFRFGEVLTKDSAEILIDLQEERDLPTGAWPVPPQTAIALPLATAGDASRALLLVGLSPYRLLAEPYLGFLKLIAGAIASAISDAAAVEHERKRIEALAELDRAKTAFFANVSHEFRTPLTLMLGPLEDVLMQEKTALPEPVRLELDTVRRNGLRLQKLVNALLDFSRLEAGRLRASFRPVDAATLTADLARSFGSVMEKAGLRLELDCPALSDEDRPYVDQELWEKVVLNLVSNAFKHTFEGEVRVAVHRRGGDIQLVVSDTGIGIAASELPHIFERFRRVDGSRSRTHEGSGIGLALVREIVTLHGGEITASSVTEGDDHGSVFTVRIPLGQDHLPPGQVASDEPALNRGSTEATVIEAERWLPEVETAGEKEPHLRTEGARILVAEDNGDMRAYLVRLLSPHYVIESVGDGEAALDSMRLAPPDLVVTDVMMPRLDGFGLVKAIRASDDLAHLPIIMLSARAGEESKIEGLDAGADDYLVKPFSSRELLAKVDSALVLARARHAVSEAQRQSEERLKGLFLGAPAIICVLKGPDHVFELANPLYLRLIGREHMSEVLGKPLIEVLPEMRSQDFVAILDGVYRTGEPYFGTERVVKLDRQGTGELEDVILNFVYQPARDTDGKVESILVHAIDVTDQVMARRQVEELAQELEQRVQVRTAELLAANEQLQGFTYSVAHDLRQQIRGISINAAIILSDVGDRLDEESQVHLNRLVKAAKQLGELVDDLLGYARLGTATPKTASIDLSTLAREVGESLLQDDQCAPNTELIVGETPIASGDPSMFRIVLINLLGNACKYSRKAAQPRVEFGYTSEGYFVRDNGVGFDMAYAHKLFKPFERLHNDEDFGGTGIGLANVARVIEKHGGRIWAESRLNEGSTFWFNL